MTGWKKQAAVAAAVVALVYAVIYVDVVLRARSAFLQGEQYWYWSEHPEDRARYLEEQMRMEQTKLESQHAKGHLNEADYQRDLELLQFDHEQALKESTIKYAYIWYQTAVDLFSPPDSRWVQRARVKMPLAKERWKAELKSKNIPFEDYMLD
jgi:hypothetical protein